MGEGFSIWAMAIFGGSLLQPPVVARDSVPIISFLGVFGFGGIVEDAEQYCFGKAADDKVAKSSMRNYLLDLPEPRRVGREGTSITVGSSIGTEKENDKGAAGVYLRSGGDSIRMLTAT